MEVSEKKNFKCSLEGAAGEIVRSQNSIKSIFQPNSWRRRAEWIYKPIAYSHYFRKIFYGKWRQSNACAMY
jgi:hypothetical protein